MGPLHPGHLTIISQLTNYYSSRYVASMRSRHSIRNVAFMESQRMVSGPVFVVKRMLRGSSTSSSNRRLPTQWTCKNIQSSRRALWSDAQRAMNGGEGGQVQGLEADDGESGVEGPALIGEEFQL